MYSRWLGWNHRLRLTALLTATVSLSLAAVFVLVVWFVRDQAKSRRFAELEVSVARIASEWNTPDSLREVNEDFPGLEIAVYSDKGTLLASTTKRVLPVIIGRSKRDDSLLFGLHLGPNIFVGVNSWVETEVGLRQLAFVLAALWLPLVLLTAIVSWHGGGLVLRPVKELVDSAEELSGTSEGRKLTTTDRAEFASLAESLNQMIERVRYSASLQEQFASDAAHELRTPLALMRTRVETNLKRERSAVEHVDSQKALLKQIERLTLIVETLLQSARQQIPHAGALCFNDAVTEAVKDWIEARQWSNEELILEVQPCNVSVSKEEVAIIVRNLLDNAATHSPQGSTIFVTVLATDEGVTLSVRDSGPGLTDEDKLRAFDRFFRSDEGRSRNDGGAGIGLSVVKRIVEAAGGSIKFLPTESGALVSVWLPDGTR